VDLRSTETDLFAGTGVLTDRAAAVDDCSPTELPTAEHSIAYTQTLTVLDAATQAFAFGADRHKFTWMENGAAVYAGQHFNFSYVPDGAVFTVTDQTGDILAQTVQGQINWDYVAERPTAVVEQFAALSQIMATRGVTVSTSSPAASYQQALPFKDVAMLPVSQPSIAQWSAQAVAIGRSPEYLAKIAQTTQSAQLSGLISQKADAARCIDAEAWQAMVDGAITDARSIVEQSGTATATGQSFVGKIYRIDVSPDRLTIQAKDRGEILRVEQGAIVQAQINHQDASLFGQQVQWVKPQRGHPITALSER
jgi:hypothetical protein